MTVKGLRSGADQDFKVSKCSDTEFEVTCMESGKTEKHTVSDYDFTYNSLCTLKLNG